MGYEHTNQPGPEPGPAPKSGHDYELEPVPEAAIRKPDGSWATIQLPPPTISKGPPQRIDMDDCVLHRACGCGNFGIWTKRTGWVETQKGTSTES